jgi:hypothetical protein
MTNPNGFGMPTPSIIIVINFLSIGRITIIRVASEFEGVKSALMGSALLPFHLIDNGLLSDVFSTLFPTFLSK